MEAYPNPSTDASHSSSSSSTTLGGLSPRVLDNHDHEDSPMRKKPRLDSQPSSPTASTEKSSQSTPTTPEVPSSLRSDESPAADITPSKVTLNLRAPKDRPTTRQRSPHGRYVPGHGVQTMSPNDRALPQATEDDVAILDASCYFPHKQNSPPVIDISLDEPENETQGEHSQADEASLQMEHIVRSFPGNPFHNSTISTRHLEALADWFNDCVQFTQSRRDQWYSIFTKYYEFFRSTGAMVQKLLGKKYEITVSASRYSGHASNLLHMLENYVVLCNQLATTDRMILRRGSEKELERLHCIRHLRNLQTLVLRVEHTQIWKVIVELAAQLDEPKSVIPDNTTVATELAASLLLSPTPSSCPWFELLAELTATLNSRSAMQDHMINIMKITSTAVELLGDNSATALGYIDQVEEMQYTASSTIVKTLDDFLGIVENQKPYINSDFAAKFIDSICANWKATMTVLALDTDDAIQPWAQASTFLDEYNFAEIQSLALHLKSARRLLGKGRLELRVLGAFRLGEMLVGLFKFTNGHDKENYSDVRECTAQWLLEEKVVEQLLSIDSHPGLVSQSSNILGFLFATHTWHSRLTDAALSTLLESQDTYLTSSIIDSLTNSMGNANGPTLKAFLKRMSSLPESTYTPVFSPLFSSFMKTAAASSDPDTMILMFRIASAMLRNLVSSPCAERDEYRQAARSVSASIIQLCLHDSSNQAVQLTCQECILSIRTQIPKAPGSAEVLGSILIGDQGGVITDLILHQLQGLDVLARTLIALSLTALEGNAECPFTSLEYDCLLQLLVQCMTLRPQIEIDRDTEARLFDSLVGHAAINEYLRHESWIALSRICREASSKPLPFIERCIKQYLPALAPEYYSVGLVDFTTEAVRYRLRLDGESCKKPIQIPLTDYLWMIILRCPSDMVATASIRALCEFHVANAIVATAPTAAVALCHESLVDRVIVQLEDCADHLRIRSPELNSSISSPTIKDGNQSLMFQRAIDCLHTFLHEVQQDSRYVLKHDDRSSSSPMLKQKSPSDKAMKIKFQAFPPGKRIEVLEIDPLVPLSEMYEALRQTTRFPELRTIFAGHPVDLRRPSDASTVKDLFSEGGLLIVKNLQNDKLLPSDIDTSTSRTTAGDAVLAKFGKIYPLLDLPSDQSHCLYKLMKQFPPYVEVDTMLKSTRVSTSLLFHPRRKYRTLYSLHCALQIINGLDCANDEDRECLEHIGSKIFKAFADPTVASLYIAEDAEREVAELFVQGLLHCLHMKSTAITTTVFETTGPIVTSRLCDLLLHAKDRDMSSCASLVRMAYDAVVELAKRCKDSLSEFVHRQGIIQIHAWLLIQHPDAVVRQHAQRCTISLIHIAKSHAENGLDDTLMTFWGSLFSLVPTCREFPERSQFFFQLMSETCTLVGPYPQEQSTTPERLDYWVGMLVDHQRKQAVSPEVPEPFVSGLSRLIATFLISTKLVVPADKKMDWITAIFERLLFPPISSKSAGPLARSAATTSILHTDARKQLYDLVLVLCTSERHLEQVLQLLQASTEPLISDDILTWEEDRHALVRSTSGYSGLRNLANTCYMNSLMTQLFMNNSFRNFIVNTPVSNEKGSQKLLAATQRLFGNMHHSQRKFADTKDFALAVKPYDGDYINVNIQMDVDEFYNLLFEQWEDQLVGKDAKRDFRSIYGGTSVTQIKSLDCEHVSERTEEYLTVSCEVKGKQSLQESLQASVAGDSMEGDNKYKCESCGNRYVNAVKRSCLKEVPDHLAFHLKRFDFDLLTMQRRKIDEHFTFPQEIDMAPYTYDAVAGEGEQRASDMFKLSGILVHSGTAEHGHYYSYIRDGDHQLEDSPSWLEFNDTEVTPFDPGKIPESCFGGYFEHNQVRWSKMHSAYMLFYERKEKRQCRGHVATQMIDRQVENGQAPENFNATIAEENDLLIRWFCLMDPEHGDFVRTLVANLQVLSQDVSSPSHADHTLVSDMAKVIVKYLQWVACRVKGTPKFEASAFALESLVMGCSQCCSVVADLLSDGQHSAQTDLLLHCPSPKVRTQTKDFLLALMRELCKTGVQATSAVRPISKQDLLLSVSSLPRVFTKSVDNLLREVAEIGFYCRRWHEYFSALLGIAELGRAECVVLLSTELLACCMMLLFTNSESDGPVELDHRFYLNNIQCINRERKFVTYTAVLNLTAHLLQQVDPGAMYRSDASERLHHAEDAVNLLPVTLIERDLAYFTELTRDNKEIYCLVSKSTEAVDDRDADAQCPLTIVSQMLLNCASVPRAFEKMTKTVAFLINEYAPEYQYLPLRLAIRLCEVAPSKKYGTHVVDAINAKIISSVDESFQVLFDNLRRPISTTPETDGFIASCLKTLADMETPSCAARDGDFPYRKHILRTCSHWGSRLLQYDSRQGRERTLETLKGLLLHEIAPVADGDLKLPDEEDLRLQALVCFGLEGIKVYADAESRRIPRSFRVQLLEALECCMAVIKAFADQRTVMDAFEDAYDMAAEQYARLLRQWQLFKEHYIESVDTDDNQADDGDTEAVSDVDDNDDNEPGDTDAMTPSINESPPPGR